MSLKGLDAHMQLGEKLKAARKAGSYTQKAFADLLDVPASTYSNYENGNRIPPADVLERAAEALKTPLRSLLSVDTGPSPLLSFFDWLLAVGYDVVIYEEEEWRTVNLRDTASHQLHMITDDDLDDMRDKVAAFTRFQVAEIIAKRAAEMDGEPNAT